MSGLDKANPQTIVVIGEGSYEFVPAYDPSYTFREDDHVRVDLGYHF